jgi:hypothetical protein
LHISLPCTIVGNPISSLSLSGRGVSKADGEGGVVLPLSRMRQIISTEGGRRNLDEALGVL